MTKRKNIAASIRQRLLNRARSEQRPFDQRGTPLVDNIVAFQTPFITEKQLQWTAFCRRLDQEHLPEEFADIITQIETFLGPVVDAASSDQPFNKVWKPADGWS